MQPRLKVQAQEFETRLAGIKQDTRLHEIARWYPWSSLSEFEVLDDFLEGDTEALLRMIGGDPVVDVGCGDGDNSFFLESLGARVDAVDYAPTNYNALLGVRRLKEILNSPLTITARDIDKEPEFPGESYGLALMLGLVYHLKNPFLVLEALARRARYGFFNTRVAQYAPDRKMNYGQFPLAYLVDEDELNHDKTNFWIFTNEGFHRLVRRAGWDIVHAGVVGPLDKSDPITPEGDSRSFILAKSRLVHMYRLLEGWHEMEDEDRRWTERRFAVETDVDLALEKASLRFAFDVPHAVLAAHGRVKMRVRAAGRELPEAEYTTSGRHEYTAAIGRLGVGRVRVDFELEHALAGSGLDVRELGVLVRFGGAPPFGIA